MKNAIRKKRRVLLLITRTYVYMYKLYSNYFDFFIQSVPIVILLLSTNIFESISSTIFWILILELSMITEILKLKLTQDLKVAENSVFQPFPPLH